MNSLIHVVVIFLQQYMEFSLNMTIFHSHGIGRDLLPSFSEVFLC